MSLDVSGMDAKVSSGEVSIIVSPAHPLIKLSNRLDWEALKQQIIPDLKATTFKGKWWLGRKLKLRIHLGIYILQHLYNLTDRKAEYSVKDNAAFQIFCGKGIVKNWHCPDHTKIEEFRSRLSPATQNSLANQITEHAEKLGYANASCFDIDSTICEANMVYPSDSHLLLKLGKITHKLFSHIKDKLDWLSINWEVQIKEIKAKARACFFNKENKQESLRELWHIVCSEVAKVLEFCKFLRIEHLVTLPWYIQRAYVQLQEHGMSYLTDSATFIFFGKLAKGKALSFHLNAVACFNKNKPNKKLEFGRNIQLGRIAGNFLVVGKSTDVRMEDKRSVEPMLNLHQELFGKGTLKSCSSDKGYYSHNNKAILKAAGVEEIGLQQPRLKGSLPEDIREDIRTKLVNRRAGIEPLIGHAKHGGQLGKSRMKSDRTILSSAYAAVFGFNLRQLIRYEMGKVTFQGV